MSDVSTRANFDFLRYANVWEDADILLAALDIKPTGHYLSIASGGDNALAMLSQHPASVTAIDLNPVQLYCTELKAMAIGQLDYQTCLAFLGVSPMDAAQRLAILAKLPLSSACLQHWQTQHEQVAGGVIHAGKFERYFKLFRQRALPWVHSKQRVQQLLACETLAQQQAFYQSTWNNKRWRLLFRIFFSQLVMGKLGRDPAFFEHVDEPVAQSLFKRAEHALTSLPVQQNPYLQLLLTGGYQSALPHYLRPQNFAAIKKNIDRLSLRLSSIEALPSTQKFDGANLSNIFEYVDPAAYSDLLTSIHSHCQPGARLAYWNMLVPRQRPELLAKLFAPMPELAQALYQQDKAIFYRNFIVERALPCN